jgi:hypothetical protein
MEIEAIEGQKLSFRVKCLGQTTPARFNLYYKSLGDLKIFVSKVHKDPDEVSHQSKFMNVISIVLII